MIIISEETGVKVIIGEKKSFWVANEEGIVILMALSQIIFGLVLLFSPFYDWVGGYVSYIIVNIGGVTVNGFGYGRIYYSSYEGGAILEYFSCPAILYFSVIGSVLGILIMFMGFWTINRRFLRREKDLASLYGGLSKYTLIISIACIGLSFAFFISYNYLPVYGLSGVRNLGELPQYLASLNIKVSLTPLLGPILIIIIGIISIFLGIIFSIIHAKISQQE